MNLGSLSHGPGAPQSFMAGLRDDSKAAGAQFLELRSVAGTVYVCPSRWQRVRLLWAFRHFHVLPLQVLSRRDQRLIEKLSQSAVLTPTSPVIGTTVLGVVENLYPKSPAPVARVVTMQPQTAPPKQFRPMSWTPAVLRPDFSQRGKEKEMKQIFGTAKSRDVRNVPFRQRGALGALAAACVIVIVASFYGNHRVSGTTAVNNARTLPAPASKNIKPRAAITPAHASLPTLAKTMKPKHPAAQPSTEPALTHNELASLENEIDQPTSVSGAKAPAIRSLTTIPGTIIERAPITSTPLLVSELPQGHFAHPVVSRPDLVGELQLRALIGPDGRVKNVTVLSGDPKLAAAGMRAVRQWHYAPYQVLGSPVEVETLIRMNFFGQDAVSVASVATVRPPGSPVASIPSPHDQPLSGKPND